MTEQEVQRFLAQFDEARREVAAWPKWMREAAHVAAATFPRSAALRNNVQGDERGDQ
jgi:hypothetical protein